VEKKPIYISFNQKGLHVYWDEARASFHCHNCADSKKHTNIYQGTHCERCSEYKEIVDGIDEDSRTA
jgi:DNA-directed RNA polymerase subunit RPC12/RpoP